MEADEDEEADDADEFSHLPTELLVYVFSFLDIKQRILSERVCKRWSVIGKELPWLQLRSLGIDIRKWLSLESALASILSRYGNIVRRLQIINHISSSEEFRSKASMMSIQIICRYCANLLSLNMVGFMFSQPRLRELAEKCLKLRGVSIRYGTKLNEDELGEFLELSHELECVYLDAPIIGTCFGVVGPKLRSVSVRSYSLQDIALENIMLRCPDIMELRLSACKMNLIMLRKCLEKYKLTLRVVEFEKWYGVNWCDCLRILSRLQVLSLPYCSDVDDVLLYALARNCPHLVNLNICCTGSLVSDKGLAFLSVIPSLKILNVSDNTRINGRGIRDLALQGQLEELYVSSTFLKEECLHFLAKWCPKIRILDVRWNRQISDSLLDVFYDVVCDGFLTHPVTVLAKGTSITSASKSDLIEVDFVTQLTCSIFCRPNPVFPNHVVL